MQHSWQQRRTMLLGIKDVKFRKLCVVHASLHQDLQALLLQPACGQLIMCCSW